MEPDDEYVPEPFEYVDDAELVDQLFTYLIEGGLEDANLEQLTACVRLVDPDAFKKYWPWLS